MVNSSLCMPYHLVALSEISVDAYACRTQIEWQLLVWKGLKMLYWIIYLIASFFAGAVQTITGFGAGIFLVLALTGLFDLVSASAINTSICLILSFILAFRFRTKSCLKLVLFPAFVYVLVSVFIINYLKGFNLDSLAIAFGTFLIALSTFFLCFSSRIRMKSNYRSAFLAAGVSGVFSGLFSIGGPLMGIYFLNVTEDHESYLGNIQLMFAITNMVNMAARVANGQYAVNMVPASVLGILFVLIGIRVGSWVYSSINVRLLKTIIYIFVGISGVITILQHL